LIPPVAADAGEAGIGDEHPHTTTRSPRQRSDLDRGRDRKYAVVS
jgi:hypothetical protein